MRSTRHILLVLAFGAAVACSDDPAGMDASVNADASVRADAAPRPDATVRPDATTTNDDATVGDPDATAGDPDAMTMPRPKCSDFVRDLILNRTTANGAPVPLPDPADCDEAEDQAEYQSLF